MDAILGWLQNPIVLAAAGIVVKFVPGVRQVIQNRLIPWITIVLAWLGGLAGPAEAHAAAWGLTFGVPLFGLGAALWQAAQAYILHEWLLRPVLPKRPADSV